MYTLQSTARRRLIRVAIPSLQSRVLTATNREAATEQLKFVHALTTTPGQTRSSSSTTNEPGIEAVSQSSDKPTFQIRTHPSNTIHPIREITKSRRHLIAIDLKRKKTKIHVAPKASDEDKPSTSGYYINDIYPDSVPTSPQLIDVRYVESQVCPKDHPSKTLDSVDRELAPFQATLPPQNKVSTLFHESVSYEERRHRSMLQRNMFREAKSERRDPIRPPSIESGGIPQPSDEYLQRAAEQSISLEQPQHLLIVIDLNGTILHRPDRKVPTKFIPRPHAQPFLQYCLNTFTVVIWSSARKENVLHMCNAFLSSNMRKKTAAIWGRDRCGLTKSDYNARVQCYKRMKKIWEAENIQASHPAAQFGGKWDQTNTVILDDSKEKARADPFNLVRIPEFLGDVDGEGDILPKVHDYLNQLSMQSNVSGFLRTAPPLFHFPDEREADFAF